MAEILTSVGRGALGADAFELAEPHVLELEVAGEAHARLPGEHDLALWACAASLAAILVVMPDTV